MLPTLPNATETDEPARPFRRRGSLRPLVWDSAIMVAACAPFALMAMLSTGSYSYSDGFLTAPVAIGDMEVRVHATGTVEPTRLIEVSTELSGTLKRVLVKPNDRVKAGQLLAELDSTSARAQLARARAQLAAATARLKDAKAGVRMSESDLDRKRRLQLGRHTSQRDLDSAEYATARSAASVESLTAEIEAAEADLQLAEATLARTRIVSPVNGVVLRRNVEQGQTIAASLQAPVLFRLAENLDQMQIRVDVDEADAMSVAEGQSATFSVQAVRNRRFPAQVEAIHVGPEIVQGVVTYKAILAFDNKKLRLKPGMTASADITVERVHQGLLVPNAAFRFAPSAGFQKDRAVGDTATNLILAVPAARAAQPLEAPPHLPGPTESDVKSASRRLHVLVDGILRQIHVDAGATDGRFTVVSGPHIRVGMRVVIDFADRPGEGDR